MFPEQLFPRPGGDFLSLLAALPRHLDAAMPMRRQHRQELPGDIRRLSHLLTDERDELRRDYLTDPAAVSAYLRYFLPWNIYRLGVLFAGLALDPGGDNPDDETTVIDLGSGPLTAPLALWMSRPHLRRRRLHFICVDRAPKPMRLGLDVLASMAVQQGGLAPWRITLVKGALDAHLREKAGLVIMANALNEVLHRGEGDLLEDAEDLARQLCAMLTPTGQLLLVEPGIRPSAHLISALRRGLLHRGLLPLAPCPHTGPCPMSGRGYTAWCHFNFDAAPAPAWLRRLSEEARLAKDNVSLSFLHFSAKARRLEAAPGKDLVRAVSGPFELPGTGPGDTRRYGQYACSDRGLTLLSLPRKHLVPAPGTLLEAAWPEVPAKDAKSGAFVLPLGPDSGLGTASPRRESPEAAPADRPERKPPRLPSERPLERGPRPRKPAAAAKPDARPAARPADRPADPAAEKPASGRTDSRTGNRLNRPADTEEGRSSAKRTGKPEARTAGKPSAKTARATADKLAVLPPDFLEELLAEDADLESAGKSAHGPRRPAKKKPGQPAVKKTSKAKKGGKSVPKAESRAARKAKKAKKAPEE